MIKISASAFEHSDFLKLSNAVPTLRAESIGIEYFYDTMPFFVPDFYREKLSGIRCSMHCPMKEINLLAPEGSITHEYTMEKMNNALKLAHELSCVSFVLHTHVTASPLIGDKENWRKLAAERIRHIVAMSEKFNIMILVENVGAPYKNTVLFSQEEFEKLIISIPQINCLLDVGHARLNNWDIPALIAKLGKRLHALHLHDNFGNKDLHLPVFCGDIDFHALTKAVKKANPEAELVIEYLPPSCDDLTRMMADGKRLKQMIKEEKS